MKILIADDEKDLLDILKERLGFKGYDVDIASDGKEAMTYVASNNYDLVIVDHNMPEFTGIEVIRYIKGKNLSAKIVMLTGYPSMKDFFAKSIGADEYLSKPMKILEVEELIKKYA
ncbi:Signal transduction response regulator, receiver region domain protein [Candidatus Omnitrophus magneticus]|uniref:Signal transduction response regulator, receiver region domain protein n=1 Tax=Candidatus Omnitrophus magneticus TaxID=1609969 RepID=A0A0F0CP01_9BACT|nr:Signal transduction response regulator, receiver region domain protein [Candidatus Omnitrophus magneticus]